MLKLMTYTLSTAFLLSTCCLAAPANLISYEVNSKISIDGKPISSPRIITLNNQKSSISQTNVPGMHYLKINMLVKKVSDEPRETVNISYDVRYKNGLVEIHTKPALIVLLNKPARIIATDQFGHSCEIDVVVSKGS